MTSAPNAVLNLVKRFDNQLEAYRSGRYKETPVRHDFIDPLFEALGWDINNLAGDAEIDSDAPQSRQKHLVNGHGGAVE